jgi:hypothetical protein
MIEVTHFPPAGEPGDNSVSRALFSVYLPLTTNDGRPQPMSRLHYARDRIVAFAGGCTVLPTSEGLWVNEEGTLCRDLVVPLLVLAPAGVKSEQFFGRLAAELALLLEQQEIFVTWTPAATIESPLVAPVAGSRSVNGTYNPSRGGLG